MSQFPRFPSPGLWVRPRDDPERLRVGNGFPHSDIPGWQPAHGFPRLIAVFHVLHRHLAPRHPPHALGSLDSVMRRTSSSSDAAIQLLRCPPAAARATGRTVVDLMPAAPPVAPQPGSAALLRIALRLRSRRSAAGGSTGLKRTGPAHRRAARQGRLCWSPLFSSSNPVRFRSLHLFPSLVEMRGFEPLTPALQKQCSPN